MNSLGLIYKEFILDSDKIIPVSHANNIYKDVRHTLKPMLSNFKLKPNNKDGKGAAAFFSSLPRYKFNWLDFILPDYVPSASDYPNETELQSLGILKDTEIGDVNYWREAIQEQTKGGIFLLFGLQLLKDETKPELSFWTSRIPGSYFPCNFKLHECVITNAPLCQYLRYRYTFLI